MDNKKLVNNTLSSKAFWQVNKTIAKKVGNTAAILLAELIYRRDYWEANNGLQSDGTFYKLAAELEEDLNIGPEARITAQNRLIKAGFLTIVRHGIPSKNFYKIDDNAIAQTLGGSLEELPKAKTSVESTEQFQSADYLAGQKVQPKPIPIPTVKQKSTSTFSDILNNWSSERQGELPKHLSSKNGALYSSIDELLTSCEDAGLQRADIDVGQFKRKVKANMGNLLQKNPGWEEQIWDAFNQTESTTYAPPVKSVTKMTHGHGARLGMSDKEYDSYRDYAEAFPAYNTVELEDISQQQDENKFDPEKLETSVLEDFDSVTV